ncbi:hypothetical protein ACHAWX_003817 [Stephanocyclus meneghinianus]
MENSCLPRQMHPDLWGRHLGGNEVLLLFYPLFYSEMVFGMGWS